MLIPNLPIYLRDVTFTTETKDGETRRVVKCAIRIAPFSSELAEALGPGVRERLFTRNTADPVEDVAEIKFRIAEPFQELRVKLTKDSERDTLVIPDVRVSSIIRVKRDKETPTFEANIDIDFNYPSKEELYTLVSNINNQLIVTFNDQQTTMLDEQRSEDEKQPKKRQKAAPAGESAAAGA